MIRTVAKSSSSINLQCKRNIWLSLREVFEEFSSETSIHGLKYTTQRKLQLDRFIWLIIVSISILCAAQMASRFYERNSETSIRTNVVSSQFPAWKVPMPAVTLCHGTLATMHELQLLFDSHELSLPHGVTRSELEEALKHLREAIQPTNRFGYQLSILQRVLSANRMTVQDLIERVRPNCSKYLIMCIFEDETKPCDTIISPSLSPYGTCCSFNFRYNQDKRNETSDGDVYTATFGSRFALSLLIDSYPQDRLSTLFYGDGIKVLVHGAQTYPGFAAFDFVATAGRETIVHVKGTRRLSSPDILRLAPNVRSCYQPNEFIPPYRTSNCYGKCRDEAIYTLCGCLPFYSSSTVAGERMCNFTHASCLARIMVEVYSMRLRDPECGCLSQCEDTTYTVTTTTASLDAAKYHPGRIYREAVRVPNSTVLHITYGAQVATIQQRDVVQSWINLLSSLGGVFNLFLGCSFVSLVEILYFFCVCLLEKLQIIRMSRSVSTRSFELPCKNLKVQIRLLCHMGCLHLVETPQNTIHQKLNYKLIE